MMPAEAKLIFSGISDITVTGQRVLPAPTVTNTEMLNASALKLKRSMLPRASKTAGTGIQGLLPSCDPIHSLIRAAENISAGQICFCCILS